MNPQVSAAPGPHFLTQHHVPSTQMQAAHFTLTEKPGPHDLTRAGHPERNTWLSLSTKMEEGKQGPGEEKNLLPLNKDALGQRAERWVTLLGRIPTCSDSHQQQKPTFYPKPSDV